MVFTYTETLVENIADFVDMDHSMCIFGSPAQLIDINKGLFEHGESNDLNRRGRPPCLYFRKGCRKLFKICESDAKRA